MSFLNRETAVNTASNKKRKERGMSKFALRKGMIQNEWRKVILKGAVIALITAFFTPFTVFGAKKLVDDGEYTDKDFKKCNISDYSDMVDGDDISWVSTGLPAQLSQYKLKVGKVENKSDIRSKSLVSSVKSTFSSYFTDMDTKGEKGTLTADICIYMAENFVAGKAWIPFVGGHQMQAALGVEMVLHDGKNRTVAKFRHSAREGLQIEQAAQEVAGDLVKYISNH
jgi:hypothetical protein